jgi:hypothetical protein
MITEGAGVVLQLGLNRNHIWKLVDEAQQHFDKDEQKACIGVVHQNDLVIRFVPL